MQYFTINYLFALIVVATAYPHYIPISTIEHIPNPNYSFNYAVNDPSTGDNKGQWEVRDGDQVKGSYSLVEPDGSLRIVDYHANDHTGFNAVVKRVGPGLHPTAMPLAHVAIAPAIYEEIKPLPAPYLHPLTFAPLTVRMPEPIPKPMVPITTYPYSSHKQVGPFAKPIVVAEPVLPIEAFNPLHYVPLMMPPEGPTYGMPHGPAYNMANGPAPLRISGATYGKHGISSTWSSGPIDLHGKSFMIRHRH